MENNQVYQPKSYCRRLWDSDFWFFIFATVFINYILPNIIIFLIRFIHNFFEIDIKNIQQVFLISAIGMCGVIGIRAFYKYRGTKNTFKIIFNITKDCLLFFIINFGLSYVLSMFVFLNLFTLGAAMPILLITIVIIIIIALLVHFIFNLFQKNKK